MTHGAATIAGINKRIAEFDGWVDIQPNPNYLSLWRGRRNDMNPVEDCPDYWHSADAVLPVVERLCRERNCRWESVGDGTSYTIEVWGAREVDQRKGCTFWPLFGKGESGSLPAAACLAVVAVLDGAENETNNERTSE